MLPVGRMGLYTLLVALPIAVEVPPDSTGENRGNTRITAIGGVGTFALIDRGCENQVIATHPYEFREVAGAVEHEFPNGLAIGVRGGKLEQSNDETYRAIDYPPYPPVSFDSMIVVRTKSDNAYIHPTIAYERNQFGVGGGWIFAREPFVSQGDSFDPGPSFHVRLGRRDGVRLELNYMENLPLYSGGGYAELGLGMHLHQLVDVSFAVGTSPFDGPGLGLEVDYRVLPNWSLLGRARLGHTGGESQSGGALGLSYSTRPPLPRHRNPKNSKDPNDVGWRGGLEAKRPKEPPPVTTAPSTPAAVAATAALPAVEKYPKYGDYQPVDSLAVPVLRAEPVAPDTTTGTVPVAALVDWNGSVVETRVIRSIPALDAAAIECASRWTFRPAIHEGRRVASWVTIPVRFGIE